MLLESFVSRAIVVDNKENELDPLVDKLKEKDICVDRFTYGIDELKTFHRNRQLIFIDILLNENPNQSAENISLVIDTLSKLCGEGFGLYGLVLWTKHPENINELKERISRAAFPPKGTTSVADKDDEEEETASITIQPPLFILALDKNKYIRAGYDYSSLPQDIEDTLKKDSSAYFFVKWSMSVMLAKDNAVTGIYQMVTNYNEQEQKLPYLLYELAKNQTGAPSHHTKITSDAYNAFDELLYSELASQQKNETIPTFTEDMPNPFGTDIESLQCISAKLNERICIDLESISQDLVVPGNVYILSDQNSLLRIDIEDGAYKNILEKIDQKTIVYVAIELTPPCDFSQSKKINSRLVGGIVFEIPLGHNSKKKNKVDFKIDKKNKGDNKYVLYPITVGNDNVVCAIFDFRYLITLPETDLNNTSNYKIWFRAKPKLFADVLQKFSSHAARLGLSNINLAKPYE